ncbi:MAG: hypothetical protein IT258_02775 [Saprospiraceae bacterium]|nr:hypothetical protein [Saprospiraceae bacterium]
MKKFALFLFAIAMTIFACRKDVDHVDVVETPYVPPILKQWEQPIRSVTGTLIVFVSNEAGAPVPDAKVELGNQTLTTDQYGHAFFRDADMNAEGTFIKVENSAYFTGSRRFFPVDGAETRVKVELIAKQFNQGFASQDGGVVEVDGGASITFPENSIRKANGTPYNGAVKVAAHWLDPTNPRTLDRMPGNLQGINNQGTEVVMATYGMVVAELQDEDGNPLNILKDKTATIKMPVPTSQLATAPAEIPLWSYYEEYGVWAEEGKASLQNGVYVGEVSHFSFWNCDYPYPALNFTAKFVDENGNPLVNYHVTLKVLPNGGCGHGYTDNMGEVGGLIPEGEEMLLEVYGQCYEVIYSAQIGPFTADVDLGQIVVPNSALNPTTLTGQLVDCNNQPVLNGIAIFQFDGQTVYEYTTTGSFDVSFSTCTSSGDVTITGVDMDALLQSTPVTAPVGSTTNLGQISVCAVQLQNFIRVTVDGVTAIYTVASATQDSSSFANGTTFNYYSPLNFNPYISFDVSGQTVGSYGGSSGNLLYILSDNQNGWNLQWSQSFDILEITEYGSNIGDKIIGNFSGTMVNNATQPPQNVSVSGDFNITRDF